ncbi:MAG: ribose 5-phosphate isomerase B [Bacillota bacterium]|nr:ribose 5-phosphate isomerase B [Bacillota bacterium]
MNIAIGSDHAGFRLKNEIIKHIEEKGIEFKDYGTYNEDSCDYPDFAEKVASKVASKEFQFGILVCGTGVGIGIAANKVKGIRAVTCSDTFSAHASRQHNDANILCLGQRVIGIGLAFDIVDAFLSAEFEGGRHTLRINKITEIENKN